MQNLTLDNTILRKITGKIPEQICKIMKDDIVEIVLYGSCARGDYTDDSDIDIALITKSDRLEAKKYAGELAALATTIAMNYFAVVNFVCLPYDEFVEKKSWYAYFKNIETEGVVLYGAGIL